MMLALSVGVGVASSLIRAFVHGLSPVSGVSASQPPGPSVSSIGAVPALAPTDCTRVTAAEVTAALRRTVRPIATSIGCTWGCALDDPATTLVTIQMSASHAAYDTQLETSVKQHRVVYGTGYDGNFHLGTALWVAAGEPIGVGPARVIAKADTYVVVATTALGVSDDRARVMALAIASAATARSPTSGAQARRAGGSVTPNPATASRSSTCPAPEGRRCALR